ncbi:MAG: hypothetical protein M3Y04_09660, partial [Actinomycetota bacterium]|nr:hypothetical protein [Actinomycetota bacterium]
RSTTSGVNSRAVATAATAPPAAVARAAAPIASSPELRCAAAMQWVNAHGLALPAGWGYRCPGLAVVNGAERWGVACWNCDGPGNWIAVDIGRIGSSDDALHYVVAHETCHADDYALLGLTTELSADLCAALHGAPRP